MSPTSSRMILTSSSAWAPVSMEHIPFGISRSRRTVSFAASKSFLFISEDIGILLGQAREDKVIVLVSSLRGRDAARNPESSTASPLSARPASIGKSGSPAVGSPSRDGWLSRSPTGRISRARWSNFPTGISTRGWGPKISSSTIRPGPPRSRFFPF